VATQVVRIVRWCRAIFRERPHRGCHLRLVELSRLAEIAAGNGVQTHRKLVGPKPQQRLGEFVDGVVGARPRAVAARIRNLESQGQVDLLGRLDDERERLPSLGLDRPPIGIERERRIDQIPFLVREVGDAVHLGLFIAREQHDEIPRGFEALALQADEIREQRSRARLVVGRSAPVEVAILFDELEGRHRPVLGQRFDDVEMREHQYRLSPAPAAKSCEHAH
jgi:hypothetical protein